MIHEKIITGIGWTYRLFLGVLAEFDVDILAVMIFGGREPETLESCGKLDNTIGNIIELHVLEKLCSGVLHPQGGSGTLSDVGTRPGAFHVNKSASLDILVDVVGVLVENNFDLEVLRGT